MDLCLFYSHSLFCQYLRRTVGVFYLSGLPGDLTTVYTRSFFYCGGRVTNTTAFVYLRTASGSQISRQSHRATSGREAVWTKNHKTHNSYLSVGILHWL
uniref:Uncharacterized protein n=1 Tax=Periophthalmus magnuspinnatus TaxID=409849 RepID=A0A3B3ZGP7_9GOBI